MQVAKVTEIISSSSSGFVDAMRAGIERAEKTLKNIKTAWVKDQKCIVNGGHVEEYRVTMMITFVLDDDD